MECSWWWRIYIIVRYPLALRQCIVFYKITQLGGVGVEKKRDATATKGFALSDRLFDETFCANS